MTSENVFSSADYARQALTPAPAGRSLVGQTTSDTVTLDDDTGVHFDPALTADDARHVARIFAAPTFRLAVGMALKTLCKSSDELVVDWSDANTAHKLTYLQGWSKTIGALWDAVEAAAERLALTQEVAAGRSAEIGESIDAELAVSRLGQNYGVDLPFADTLANPDADHLIVHKIKDDTMRPEFEPGDFVLVDTRPKRFADSVFLIEIDGSRSVKRLQIDVDGMIDVRPRNEKYPSFRCRKDEINIIGPVLKAAHLKRYW